MSLPPSDLEQIKGKIFALQEAIQQQLPNYVTILKDIHRSLQADGTAVVLLSEEEVAAICLGLSKQTGIVIATAAASKSGRKKSSANTTLDDLM